jgi:4-hydroxybenzoyl-CoA reductase subunit beta
VLRLPHFTYHAPRTVGEATALAAALGPQARFVAGGTDLWPNMKRRHQTPAHVIGLRGIGELAQVRGEPRKGITLGAMVTLGDLERNARLREAHPAFVTAVEAISTPLLRNMGTIGGNLLLDTRCTYYDQTFEWREAIDFCMKRDGKICWVAPSSPRCLAVQSSDTVPLLCAIGAEVTLASGGGQRRIPIEALYRDDGIDYHTRQPGELLTAVHLPATNGWRASYRKLRRRGTFDFPVLGVGVWLRRDGERIADLRIRIGGAASQAQSATAAEELLRGEVPTAERIEAAAQAAFKPTRAMDNTDHEAAWRKKMAPVFVARALRDCLEPSSTR